jgi:hypothetical protein
MPLGILFECQGRVKAKSHFNSVDLVFLRFAKLWILLSYGDGEFLESVESFVVIEFARRRWEKFFNDVFEDRKYFMLFL